MAACAHDRAARLAGRSILPSPEPAMPTHRHPATGPRPRPRLHRGTLGSRVRGPAAAAPAGRRAGRPPDDGSPARSGARQLGWLRPRGGPGPGHVLRPLRQPASTWRSGRPLQPAQRHHELTAVRIDDRSCPIAAASGLTHRGAVDGLMQRRAMHARRRAAPLAAAPATRQPLRDAGTGRCRTGAVTYRCTISRLPATPSCWAR